MKRLKRNITAGDQDIRKKRVYEVEGYDIQLDEFERMLYTLDKLGTWGAARIVSMHYDGDGGARLSFKRSGDKELVEVKDLNDVVKGNNIDFYIE
jgi:dipeptidyl aminopeptidase/acylaminoacyl peptidase